MEEWNRENPHLRITLAKKDRKLEGEESDEGLVDVVRGGDYWLGELNRSRGMMRSMELWPAALREFAAKWSRYKASRRVMDFCDLIETAVREIRIAPKRPDVVFADEFRGTVARILNYADASGGQSTIDTQASVAAPEAGAAWADITLAA